VRKDIRSRIKNGAKSGGVSLKIGDERFHRSQRVCLAHRADGSGKEACAAVGQLVAIHRGQDDVPESESRDRFGDAAGLVGVQRLRSSGLDGTEPAGTGAHIAQEQERCRTVCPAFAEVGALRAFANGVKVEHVEEET